MNTQLPPVTEHYGVMVKVHFGGVDLLLIIVGYDSNSKIVTLIDRTGTRYQLSKDYTKGKATGERMEQKDVLKIVADAYARGQVEEASSDTFDISA